MPARRVGRCLLGADRAIRLLVRSWLIITPEYPPVSGGISDYTQSVARGLAARGDQVTVFTPALGAAHGADDAVRVEALPDRFGPKSWRALGGAFERDPDAVVLLQYVPQGFGLRGLNAPFLAWLARRRTHLWIMFHEVVFPWARGPLKHRVLAAGQRLMLGIACARVERALVSTPGWQPYLERWGRLRTKAEWSPVPSNIAPRFEAGRDASRARFRIAPETTLLLHFGTYSPVVVEPLRRALPGLLAAHPQCELLLVGRGGEEFRSRALHENPSLADRLHATGALAPEDVARALGAADLGIYPFPDGVSGRRTSLMAALSLGLPVLTTRGALTEPVWQASRAVALVPAGEPSALSAAVGELMGDRAMLAELGRRGRELYERHFSLERTLELLRGERTAE